jgi:hypothetical protein
MMNPRQKRLAQALLAAAFCLWTFPAVASAQISQPECCLPAPQGCRQSLPENVSLGIGKGATCHLKPEPILAGRRVKPDQGRSIMLQKNLEANVKRLGISMEAGAVIDASGYSPVALPALSMPKSESRKSGASQIKRYILPGAAMFVSGLLDGTGEAISFHYAGFKNRFPKANDQFWNPQESWRNKYKGGDPTLGPAFPGSTTSFAWTTDAYHLLRTSGRAIQTATLVFELDRSVRGKNLRKNWKRMVLDFAVLSTLRNIGFTATYDLMFKVPKKP